MYPFKSPCITTYNKLLQSKDNSLVTLGVIFGKWDLAIKVTFRRPGGQVGDVRAKMKNLRRFTFKIGPPRQNSSAPATRARKGKDRRTAKSRRF